MYAVGWCGITMYSIVQPFSLHFPCMLAQEQVPVPVPEKNPPAAAVSFPELIGLWICLMACILLIFDDFSSIYFHPFSWRYIILSNLKQRGQTEILKSFIILDVWCILFASFTCLQFLRKQNHWVNLLWPQLCTQSLCVGHGIVECSWCNPFSWFSCLTKFYILFASFGRVSDGLCGV